jgi:hypothetical protein
MKKIVKPIGKFFKAGFKSTRVSVEKEKLGYVIYQKSVTFWIPSKNKIVICSSMEELKEINIRCRLGLKL